MGMYAEYLKFVVSSQMDAGLRSRASASDIVQESFYEAHRDFEQFRGGSPEEFLAWMRIIVVNNLMRVVDSNVWATKRDVRREASLDNIRRGVANSSVRFVALVDGNNLSPGSEVDRQEAHSELASVLAALPDDYRRVIRLRNVEGLSFHDVARRMNRTSGAVRTLWLRALKQLRAEYVSRGGE